MEDISIEGIILQNLINNTSFARQSIPFIKEDYFTDQSNKVVFRFIDHYFRKNNNLPEKNILLIETKESEDVSPKDIQNITEVINSIYNSESINDTKWLLETAEKWCQDREMYISIVKAISIYDGSDSTIPTSAIPDLMKNALSISFKTNIGMDWIDDAENRFLLYNQPEDKIPFDLETLNDITHGGITRKTLSVILAGVHVGKTMTLVHLASGYARLGFNVLYISMEMGDKEILQRVDANMLKVSMHKIKELGKEKFIKRIDFLKSKEYGHIKVIQYPTSLGHVGHFRTVLNELNLKVKWKPDVVIVDYIGIVASSRLKVGSTNSHFYLKSVAEELRALGIEYDVAVWSAMQLTRCLALDTKVITLDGEKNIVDLVEGDSILSDKGYAKVEKIYPIERNATYKITTKSGKSIICSKKHLFPTQNGLLSLETGLNVGKKLLSAM